MAREQKGVELDHRVFPSWTKPISWWGFQSSV
jgi:hypothetical protein